MFVVCFLSVHVYLVDSTVVRWICCHKVNLALFSKETGPVLLANLILVPYACTYNKLEYVCICMHVCSCPKIENTCLCYDTINVFE